MSLINSETIWELQKAARRGLKSLARPIPMTLSEWAERHFYLSAESSYVEGKWEAFPFQPAIMDCVSNDDIRDVTWIKSARVGCTKMMLAAIGYFAHHKHRNQAIYQPVDDDADEFVKTELNPMLRDVPAVREVFPWYDSKHANNTMRQKVFTGSNLHIRGGKAAKNYRRISVDVVYIDEADGFDRDIEGEGDPVMLAEKRIEGATFPKRVVGSTPKLKKDSLVGALAEAADMFFRFHIPCPHCYHMQPLFWGGPDHEFGFKWTGSDPNTVEYLCRECASFFTQDQYLKVWEAGKWIDEDSGVWIDPDNFFRDADGELVPTPQAVAFHIWTAYSPMTEWTRIVADFLKAKKDPRKLKSFVNLTLGEPWEADQGKKIDEHKLAERKEEYHAEVPDDVLLLTAWADVQDNRVEYAVKGWGKGEESWLIDYVVHKGDPETMNFWAQLYRKTRKTYTKRGGAKMDIRLFGIDSGGHFTDEVYTFCKKADIKWAIPTKGYSIMGKPIASFSRKKDRNGVHLTMVGTDTAKDLCQLRLESNEPGEGHCHFPEEEWCDDQYFKQLTAERRKPQYDKKGRLRFEWYCPNGRRNEAWDCEVGNLVMIRLLQQHYGIDLDILAEQPHDSSPVTSVRRRRRQISEGVS